jgi:glycosyltransferase involved in cell wall biosynthesis
VRRAHLRLGRGRALTRICVIYDCLFPHTVGGAERWYRTLAERLAADGHEVTYLTLRQWPQGGDPGVPGVRVVVAGPRMALYSGPGQRRVLPPLVFGAGVLWHLLRHGRRYDVVHTASFPYFSLLGAAVARRLHGFGLVVDWHELWTREYWRSYLGAAGGRAGYAVQRACVRVHQRAFCFARVTADRLRAEGVRGDVQILEGQYTGALAPAAPLPAEPVAVFAGRHIPEKAAPAAVAGIAAARRRLPELRGLVFGDGPERGRVLELLEDGIEAPGFVAHEELERALARALCLVHPSRREGYGQVVVEASALGVPSILVRHPDNAATELVEEGVNGFVVDSDEPEALAGAIERVWAAGSALRRSTADWYARNARRLSIDASLETVARSYR